jgi:hypothetical protein
MFGIRALLCDHCNHQFKTFSLRAPKSRTPRRSPRNEDVINPASAADPRHLNGASVNKAARNGQATEPRRLTIDMDALRLQSKTQDEVAGALVVDQISPVRRDLRTEITRLYAQGAREPSRQLNTGSNHVTSASTPACAHCGSSNVKRRRRTLMERVAFSVTDHKAYTCRSCGESFYAQADNRRFDPNAVPATEAVH